MATNYSEKAKQARLKILDMVFKAQSSHIGSNFSIVDILTVLFDKITDDDQVILSAGWKASAFYYFLAEKGYFSQKELNTYNQNGSRLIGLTEPGVPGVLFAGGSMQMGVPASVGFALAKKMKGEKGNVYCIVSDGELAGGMIWESVLIAIKHELNNLTIIVDNNGLQAMGKSEDILPIHNILPTLRCLGFDSKLIDGHDFEEINDALNHKNIKPTIILAKTTKGKGVSFMENNNLYHYKNLSQEEFDKAKKEIEGIDAITSASPKIL